MSCIGGIIIGTSPCRFEAVAIQAKKIAALNFYHINSILNCKCSLVWSFIYHAEVLNSTTLWKNVINFTVSDNKQRPLFYNMNNQKTVPINKDCLIMRTADFHKSAVPDKTQIVISYEVVLANEKVVLNTNKVDRKSTFMENITLLGLAGSLHSADTH